MNYEYPTFYRQATDSQANSLPVPTGYTALVASGEAIYYKTPTGSPVPLYGYNSTPTFSATLVKGVIDISNASGNAQLRISDPISGNPGRFGFQGINRTVSGKTGPWLTIWNNGNNSTNGGGINIYNSQGVLKYTGWDGSGSVTAFRSYALQGNFIQALPSTPVSVEDHVHQDLEEVTGAPGFGSLEFTLDDTVSPPRIRATVYDKSGTGYQAYINLAAIPS